MRYLVLLFLFLFSLSSLAAPATKPEFVFVGHEIEPFYFKDGSLGVQGALYDLMKEICSKEHLICKFKISPRRTALNMVKTGTAQGSGPFGLTHQRESVLYYTPPLFKSEFIFIAPDEVAKKIKSYSDLESRSVAVMTQSLTGISLHRINQVTGNKIKVFDEPSELTVIRKTENKNYNVAYVLKEVGHSYFQHNRSTTLREIPGLGEHMEIHLVFSKKSVSETEFQKINSSVKELQKSDFIKDLATKYGLEIAH